MARLQDEGDKADYLSGSQTAEPRTSNLRASIQAFLTHLILLLSIGLLSRGEWGPALIVLAIYVVMLVGVFYNRGEHESTR